MPLITSAAVPLLSVLLGAAVTYWINIRTRQRSAREDLVNAAISAIAIAEAAQSASPRVNLDGLWQSAEEDAKTLTRTLVLGAIENHNRRIAEAREALARIIVLDSRVREYYLDPSTISDRSTDIMNLLTDIRDRGSTRRPRRRAVTTDAL
jgi:thiol:disulfide interchange protein